MAVWPRVPAGRMCPGRRVGVRDRPGRRSIVQCRSRRKLRSEPNKVGSTGSARDLWATGRLCFADNSCRSCFLYLRHPACTTRPPLSSDSEHSWIRHLGRFSGGMYIASLLGSLPLMLLPIIILARFGPRQSAYWSIAITIAMLLYQLPAAVAQALLPEVASRPSDRRYLLRRSVALIILIVIPVLTVAYIAAPMVLALFGRSYGMQSLTILRWLIVAGFITILNYASGAILFLAKKSLAISAVNIADAALF